MKSSSCTKLKCIIVKLKSTMCCDIPEEIVLKFPLSDWYILKMYLFNGPSGLNGTFFFKIQFSIQ